MITQWLKRFYADWKHANYLKLHGGVDPCEAIRSDYAALLARHNALVEAVCYYISCLDYAINREAVRMARAEVDRLLSEES